jgi:hypothetical protein
MCVTLLCFDEPKVTHFSLHGKQRKLTMAQLLIKWGFLPASFFSMQVVSR